MLITKNEFEKIYTVITAVITAFGETPTTSCRLYAFCAAEILKKHFKLKPKVKAGVFCMKLHDNEILIFGKLNHETYELHYDEDLYHVWIECEGWVLDFSSPNYPEVAMNNNSTNTHKRKMFQQKKNVQIENNNKFNDVRIGQFKIKSCNHKLKEIKKISMEDDGFKLLIELCCATYEEFKNKPLINIPIAIQYENIQQSKEIEFKEIEFSKIQTIEGRY